MADRRPNVRWALDTNFLIHLSAGKDLALSVFEIAREREIRLCATMTVIQELRLLSRNQDRIAELAFTALRQMRSKWNIEPIVLSDPDQAMVDAFAEKCLKKRLLPVAEKNDALILAEAAMNGIPFVISSDQHLLSIDASDLATVCVSAGFPLIHVLHPAQARRSLDRFN
jgi:predicted nucleic acid-binding protein